MAAPIPAPKTNAIQILERRPICGSGSPAGVGAQFLNVIESVFGGMARGIIHNSDYHSVEATKDAIDRYYAERNEHFRVHPKRAEWQALVSQRNSC